MTTKRPEDDYFSAESMNKRIAAEAKERRETPEPVHVADRDGNVTVMPPPNLSARQRLEWANEKTAMAERERKREKPFSDEELGMARSAFDKLSAARRLQIANEAAARREQK